MQASKMNHVATRALNSTPPGSRDDARPSYAFDTLSVGQSLHLDDFKKSQSARVAAIQFVKRHQLDWKFGIRKTRSGWLILRLR